MNVELFNFADIYLPPDNILLSTIGSSNGDYVKEIFKRMLYDNINIGMNSNWRK